MLFSLTLPFSMLAELDRSKPPEGGPLPSQSFPSFETIELKNGLKVFLLHSKRQPMITYKLLIDSRPGGTPIPGTLDLLASLLNKGTTKHDADAFAEATDFIGASVEAAGADDGISIYATGLSKYQRQILDLLTEAITDPLLPAEQLEKERAKLYAQLESERKEPDSLAAKLRDRVIYGGEHPYAKFPTPESVAEIKREDVEALYKATFLPGNALLAVVGDFDPKIMRTELDETLGQWKAGSFTIPESKKIEPVEGITIHLVDRPESVQSNILVAENGIAKNHPKVAEATLLNVILGGGFSGRLFQNLREKHGFTYGSYSEFIRKRDGGAFVASAEVRNEVTAAAVQEILNEIRRLATDAIEEKELKLNKSYLAGNYVISLENDRRTADRVQELNFYKMDPDFYANYVKRVENATAEDLKALAAELLKPEDLAIIVVGKASEVQAQLEKIGKVIVYDEDLKPKK